MLQNISAENAVARSRRALEGPCPQVFDFTCSATTGKAQNAPVLASKARLKRFVSNSFATLGITLSGEDMTKFLRATVGKEDGKIKSAVLLAQKPRLPIPDSHEDMGYGWWFFRKNGVAWHTGMTWGYRSVLVVDPNSRTGIAILSNSVIKSDDNKWDKRIDDAAFEILKSLTGKDRD